MTEQSQQFRTVLRGYEPAQVDRRLQELAQAAQEARARADQLAERVRGLEAAPGEGTAAPASYDHLGARVAQILSLAEDEARELVDRGQAAVEQQRADVVDEMARQRSEADRYADQRRSEADTEAARVLEDARRNADDRLDGAERDAAARLQEAEAVYEQQRARAAQAAADFETTLARRRSAAEEDFTTQMQEAQQRLGELEAHIEQTRTNAEKMHDEAVRENRRIVEEAEQQAASILGEARTLATKIRADSERELAAASQRRDSINAQLGNVRQMLATLTGGAALPFADEITADDDEPVQAAAASEVEDHVEEQVKVAPEAAVEEQAVDLEVDETDETDETDDEGQTREK
jgi:DivIVA domain-containing protein